MSSTNQSVPWNYTGGFATMGTTGYLGPKIEEVEIKKKVVKDEDEEEE